MIRWTIFYSFIAFVVIAGWYRWYIGACALIVLTAFHDHHYFTDGIMGIRGLKAYNILLVMVILQWLTHRKPDRLNWDLPTFALAGVCLYLCVVLYSGLFAFVDFQKLRDNYDWTRLSFLNDVLLNPLKFLFLGIILYDACRTRQRIVLALISLAVLATITGAYIIKLIPLYSLVDPDAILKYRLRIERDMGLHPNDVVSILVPGFWLVFSLLWMAHAKKWKFLLLGAGGIIVTALLLTQSRTGMAAFVAVGAIIGLIRWRVLTLTMLACAALAFFTLSGLTANWSRGFSESTVAGGTVTDWNEVSNGRLLMWEQAWHDIQLSPLIGHGDYYVERQPFGTMEVPSHPHNAYLDIWLQSGIVGLSIVMAVFATLLIIALKVVLRCQDRVDLAVGFSAFAAIVTNFVTGLVGHGFMPRVSSAITFCLIGLVLRVYLAKARHSIMQPGLMHKPAKWQPPIQVGPMRPHTARIRS